MAKAKSKADGELPLQGYRLIRPIQQAIQLLHPHGAERDTAGNRLLCFDQYLSLLLLYFFNSTLTSLRSLQQTTNWKKTQKALGIQPTSLGSLSEAQAVFDASHVEPILIELAAQAQPLCSGREAEALKGLTAVDGSIFAGLSRMQWALWQDDQHRAAKLHLHFEVLKGVPCQATVTPAACSEPAELVRTLQPGRLYVFDRGYASYELFAKVIAAKSSFVGRVKDNTAFEVKEERAISEQAKKAGVIRDVVLSRLGTSHHKDHLKRDMRLVIVRAVSREGTVSELWLITDRLELEADLVALAYRYRWTVELFFRWLKCILGSRHLIAQSQNGMQLQVYAAMIVSLLIAIRSGMKPMKRLYELVQFYLLGWVSDAEFERDLAKLKSLTKKTKE